MPRIIVDFDPDFEASPAFGSDSSDLVYFLSWAFSARYGANHEMSLASLVLRGEFQIDLKPLLTFADRDTEEPADEEALEKAWQAAAPLHETCELVAAAVASGDKRLIDLQEKYPALHGNIAELGRIAAAAAARGSLIRVTYLLDSE